jgi:hypothetical protein
MWGDKVCYIVCSLDFILLLIQPGGTCAMRASRNGHSETLALLLSNKADVHAADEVNIIILSFKFTLLLN